MSNFSNVVSFLLTAAVFAGAVYGAIFVVRQFTQAVESTKESLKQKGLDISSEGVSVKTGSHFNREDYIDATQRGLIKTMNAASFKKGDDPSKVSSTMERSISNGSSSGHEDGNGKLKKKLWSRKQA